MPASTADKRFVLVNHSAAKDLIAELQAAIETYNQSDPVQERQKPRFVIVRVEDAAGSGLALARQRLRLSDEVRGGDLSGFLEIIPAAQAPAVPTADEVQIGPDAEAKIYLRYETNRPTSAEFSLFLKGAATRIVQAKLMEQDQLSAAQLKALLQPVVLESAGLSRRNPRTSVIEESSEQSRFSLAVPVVLAIMLMLMVMMTATPFMQSVVEEKMARIAEVLLGSVRPLELMIGKLVGMVAVSLTTAAVYLGGRLLGGESLRLGRIPFRGGAGVVRGFSDPGHPHVRLPVPGHRRCLYRHDGNPAFALGRDPPDCPAAVPDGPGSPGLRWCAGPLPVLFSLRHADLHGHAPCLAAWPGLVGTGARSAAGALDHDLVRLCRRPNFSCRHPDARQGRQDRTDPEVGFSRLSVVYGVPAPHPCEKLR